MKEKPPLSRMAKRLSDPKRRDAARARLKEEYEAGATIRQLAKHHSITYGRTWCALQASRTKMRRRGGVAKPKKPNQE